MLWRSGIFTVNPDRSNVMASNVMTKEEQRSYPGHALIIGGSLAGLFTGVLLRSIGRQVDIYERSPRDLSSRGGGIVLQPEIVAAFHRAQVPYDLPLGVTTHERLYLNSDGSIAQRMGGSQVQTS